MSAPPNQPESRSDCRVRVAEADDLQTIVGFNCALARESEGLVLDRETVVGGARAVLDDPGKGVYFMAVIDGRTVGQTQITYEWTDWRDGWFWWIQSVYVHPDHRRSGVFGRLYAHIATLARQRGDVRGLRLYVERNNEAALRTYERVGMTCTSYRLYEQTWGG